MIKNIFKKKTLYIIPELYEEKTTDYQAQTINVISKKSNILIYRKYKNNISLLKRILIKEKIEIFKTNSNNVTTFTPINILPFIRFKIVNDINRYIDFLVIFLYFSKKNHFNSKRITWVFHPIRNKSEFNFFKNITHKIIYDCVDFYSSLSDKENAIIKRWEKFMIKNVNIVFVNSTTLKKIHSKVRKKINLVPLGFRLKKFISVKIKYKHKFPKNKPLIGYVGGINFRLDYDLLYKLISKNPKYNFVLWGPTLTNSDEKLLKTKIKIKKLKTLNNIIWGKSTNKDEMKSIIDQFDIGIIPYEITYDFNKYCYPMKLFEYFYMGKPVISTEIEELKLKKFDQLVYINKTVKEWEDTIKKLLAKSWPESKKDRQKKMAIRNSWEKKVSAIESIINNN